MPNALKAFETRLTALTPSAAASATTTPSIPGVILLATNTSILTSQPYSFACGIASVSTDRSPAPALTPDSAPWFASATKLLTSIAALQLVERGLWDLDRPVAEAVPELGVLRECTSAADDGTVHYAEDIDGNAAGARVTLRHLLTHTAGLAYFFLNPKMMAWWKAQSAAAGGRDVRAGVAGTITGGFGGALVNEPGTVWEYGTGVDWAGTLLERIYGEEQGRLGRVIQRELLDKVGVDARDVCWRRSESRWSEEEKRERWVDSTMRSEGGLAYSAPTSIESAKDDLGGGGIRMPAAAYFKVLESLLKNDGRILKPETVDKYLLQPQFVDQEGRLPAKLADSMRTSLMTAPGGRVMSGGLPVPSTNGEAHDEYEFNHGLLGALSRRKGTKDWVLQWGGSGNTQWFIDPAQGLAGLFAANIFPAVDPFMLDLAVEFRQAVVQSLASARS